MVPKSRQHCKAAALKALKLWLKIVLHSVLNRVLCVKSGICWSRGSYDALFCTQEGEIIEAVIVATQNTQATASNTSIYCMCTDISMPTSGTCTIKSLNIYIKKVFYCGFFLNCNSTHNYRLRQTVSFCFFVLLSLIGSFFFCLSLAPVGWGVGVEGCSAVVRPTALGCHQHKRARFAECDGNRCVCV